jgi:dipeptidyl aminopeptidase/acylaminoacyl peptidase
MLRVLTLCLLIVAAATCLPGCLAMHYVPAGAGSTGACPPEVEVVRFPTTGGLMLEGRMYPPDCERPRPKGERVPPPRLGDEYKRTVILHCHGVGDNDCSAMACFFTEGGFRVFQFDYRGFGHSDPAPMSNTGFAEDAVAALAYLRSRPDVDPERILVYGHSMGAAYALASAAHARAEGRSVRAVITANGFSSWRLVANHHLPVLGFLLGGVPGPDPTDWAAKLGDTPYLVTHVQDDDAVPVENAPRLYQAAVRGGAPASLHIHPDGGHAYPFWSTLEENSLERVMVDYAKTWLAERAPFTPREQRLVFEKGSWSITVKNTGYEPSEALKARAAIREPAKGAADTGKGESAPSGPDQSKPK